MTASPALATIACPHAGCGAPLAARVGLHACPRCHRTARVVAPRAGHGAPFAFPSWDSACELGVRGGTRYATCGHPDCRAPIEVALPVADAVVVGPDDSVSDGSAPLAVVESVDDATAPLAEVAAIAAVEVAPRFRPSHADVPVACPTCGRDLVVCPRPGCGAWVAARPEGRCERCGEAYRLCLAHDKAVANRVIARCCRDCGAELVPAPPVASPDALADTGFAPWESRAAITGWVRLPAPFDLAHRKLVWGRRIGGVAFFQLPTGELVSSGAPLAGGAAEVRLSRLFAAGEMLARRDLAAAPPAPAVIAGERVRRPMLVASSLRRVHAALAESPGTLYELLDVERQLGTGTTLVGGPVVSGSWVLLATRRVGDDGLGLVLARLGGARSGSPELVVIDRLRLATRRRAFLGPVLAWAGQAAMVSGESLLVFGEAAGKLAAAEHPLVGPRAPAIPGLAPDFALLRAEHAQRAGHLYFADGALAFLGADPAGEGSAIYAIVHRDGRYALRRGDRGIPETEVPFIALEHAGQQCCVEVWGGRLHVHGMLASRRTLDYEPFHDQLTAPARAGDVVACRRADGDGFELYRLVYGAGRVDLAALGRLPTPGAIAASAPLFDATGCDVLVQDPTQPERVGVMRIDLARPESVDTERDADAAREASEQEHR